MVRVEKACADCGAPVLVEAPPEGSRFANALGVLCDGCVAREAQVEAQAEAERLAEARVSRVSSSGLPEKLRSVRLHGLERVEANTEALAAADLWSRGEILGLVITGPVGVGKTWTAAAAANGYLDRRALRWFSVARMLAQAKAGFRTTAKDEVNAVLLDASMALVLDDIDKVNPTDFARDILFQAIDERVNNDTPLLVTTNMRYPELEKTYGEPIASRLAGYCKAVRIDGNDRRVAQSREGEA